MSEPIHIEQMFKAGVHYGHSARYWNPKMAPYIFGESGGIHLHDLHKTKDLITSARDFLSSIVQARGVVVFVGTKSVAQGLVKHYAQACGMPYVDQRWLGGMLTNFKTIRLRIRHLAQLEKRF
jgi:small subunit ribosomal protein S2